MKLFFSLLWIIIFFNNSLLSQEFTTKYKVKTKGITIGILVWNLELSEGYYKTSINLNDKGILSGIYSFKGEYSADGKVINNNLVPNNYNQKWVTKKKKKVVKIKFFKRKVQSLKLEPIEKEHPRINYKQIENYNDPITSFTNILLTNKPEYTIDGRRTYLLDPNKSENINKILIKEYTNLWANHKRNDLEYIEVYQHNKAFLPNKIIIKFKGNLFILNEVRF